MVTLLEMETQRGSSLTLLGLDQTQRGVVASPTVGLVTHSTQGCWPVDAL
jgi:hypothetical protein